MSFGSAVFTAREFSLENPSFIAIDEDSTLTSAFNFVPRMSLECLCGTWLNSFINSSSVSATFLDFLELVG